ncbi:hypothetical protein [Mycolicibacterium goodii]|uniref:hypothetical protein n=1 Tax=Mycolicibacterium goodii TaxID=134601 RepID=UPI00093A4C03|nr:hypothetical protein [Mycolicibacterium goodii]MBU8833323.1 hypothetical protein [Mycolicibacterium goodii]OKH63132.1 hypothetical protein EB74_13795 [Mycobacterium sp. SWH-M5]
MPPTEPTEPPTGGVAPNPNDILVLGENRWLTVQGQVISDQFGDPVRLRPATLDFWESAALRGTGKPLSDLFAGLNLDVDRRIRELEMLERLKFDAERSYATEPNDKQAGQQLRRIKERIDKLKTDLVIDLGRGGLDPDD